MAVTQRALDLLKYARCADVSDALDSLGLGDIYEMSVDMRPLVPLTQFYGVARTIELVKEDVRIPAMDYDTFDKLQYKSKFEGGYSYLTNPDRPNVKLPKKFNPGDVLVIAAHGLPGVCGSANTFGWYLDGAVGFVLDGGARDTGECIIQELPIFATSISYKHCEGRNQLYAVDEPVMCAGVLVRPGDAIVADNDGVIVIPQAHAEEVAVRAYKIQQIDRRGRRRYYERQGRPFDETVELLPDID